MQAKPLFVAFIVGFVLVVISLVSFEAWHTGWMQGFDCGAAIARGAREC